MILMVKRNTTSVRPMLKGMKGSPFCEYQLSTIETCTSIHRHNGKQHHKPPLMRTQGMQNKYAILAPPLSSFI